RENSLARLFGIALSRRAVRVRRRSRQGNAIARGGIATRSGPGSANQLIVSPLAVTGGPSVRSTSRVAASSAFATLRSPSASNRIVTPLLKRCTCTVPHPQRVTRAAEFPASSTCGPHFLEEGFTGFEGGEDDIAL